MTVDELRKAKQALDDDLSQIIGDRLMAFQESAGGLMPSEVAVTLHLMHVSFSDQPLPKLTRCVVSTKLNLFW